MKNKFRVHEKNENLSSNLDLQDLKQLLQNEFKTGTV